VRADYNGAAAGGSFLPCLVILSATGDEVARIPVSTTVAAGASATVSWFPRVKIPCPPASTPTNPLGTLFAWYDFSDTTTITLDGSGGIQQILDKSGNGHTATQATAANRPTEGVVNGLNCGVFNRTNQQWLGTAIFTSVVSNPMTVAAVFTIDEAPPGASFPGVYGSPMDTHNLLLFYGDGFGVLSTQQHTPPAITVAIAAPMTQQLFTTIFDNGSSHARLNGVDHAGATTDMGCNGITIGTTIQPNIPGEDDHLTGKVCELLFYQGHLAATQLAAVEAYLKAKWATP
jgi:hypothetical protein